MGRYGMRKRNDVREDGYFFRGYEYRRRKDGSISKTEKWTSPEARSKRAAKRKARNSFIRRRRNHWISQYKISKGCSVCGYKSHPHALHFDHIDPSKKTGSISYLYFRVSIRSLINEIRKCKILCANCHAEKTDREKDYERTDV